MVTSRKVSTVKKSVSKPSSGKISAGKLFVVIMDGDGPLTEIYTSRAAAQDGLKEVCDDYDIPVTKAKEYGIKILSVYDVFKSRVAEWY